MEIDKEDNKPSSPNISLKKLTFNSLESDDGEYDDELDLPDRIEIIDMGDGPVAIHPSTDDEIDDNEKKLSYSAVHKSPIKFNSFKRKIYIPGEDIIVKIIDIERNLTTHLLNPNLYTIMITHGNFSWIIKKRYKQIHNLHQQLVIFRTSLNIPFPTKTHKNKRKEMKADQIFVDNKKKKKRSLPRFPKKPEVLVTFDKLESRQKQLEDYLNNLLSINVYRNHPATIEFLEVSQLSFVSGLGQKGKEGMLLKRNGSTQPGQSGCNIFGLIKCICCVRCKHLCNDILCTRWTDRWFFIKDTYFGYITPKSGRIGAVVLFDQGFEVASGLYSMGLQTGFQIVTNSRQITFKCTTKRKCKEWIWALKEAANTTAREFVLPNKHRSFAPIRLDVAASWFVDGSSYMSAVADAIDNAKNEVFITDWWLSPEIYLKRPVIDGHYWRLDMLLKRKAMQGVKIFILLYKEVELALGLNSYYSKQTLTELHKNIKVLRHPDHAKAGIFLWAHHEKSVIVDQNYAFLGGIDLCYGRWDDANHRLTDMGSITPNFDVSLIRKRTSSTPDGTTVYPLPKPVYLCTPVIIEKPDTPTEEIPEPLPYQEPGDNLLKISSSTMERKKCNTPEPEHKSVLKKVKTEVKNKVKRGKTFLNLVYNPNENICENPDNDEEENRQEELADELNGSSKLWIGKDYVNFIVQDFTNLDKPFDDFIERHSTPRMPWHDVGVCVQGVAAKDVARHFIQRWNATKLEKAKNNEQYPFLIPKCYEDFKSLPIGFLNGCQRVKCQNRKTLSKAFTKLTSSALTQLNIIFILKISFSFRYLTIIRTREIE